ncbi:MAG: serine/threonine-protein kinase, partial [Acidobacteriota bacterium]
MSPVAAPATDLSTGRRWSKAQDLFEQALDQPEAEREAYVRASAQNDPWLLQSVLELLVLDEGSSPLDRSPPRRGEAREPASEASVGDLIGKYRLLEPIGAGGMGCVYRAERVDGSIRQEVAVKILRTTHLRPQDRQRFLQEQRIMAGLRHARIAQLLDYGSTPKGAAYLVMNLVEGTTITRYADDHHLPIAERTRLFLAVCDAVHHAHRRLVVHRDLKPANILVGADGEPLLLDFGIAKVLDPAEHLDGMTTRTELRVMTPSYASPEQLLGQPITTGTDVWALGVLLFELLTGRRPFDWTGMPLVEIERHLELDPKPKASAAIPAHRADAQRIALRRGLEPGRLRRRLRGDLDLIIGRALAYRSDERYGSVEALTLDLERYLAGRPVHARRPSLVYRTSKFLRRHALVVAGVAIGVAVLIGFLLLQAAQSQRLKTERDAARQERDKAQLMSELLADVLDLADPSNRKLNQAAQSMLELGKQRILRDFGQQPAAQADLLTRVGTLYRRTGAYEEAEALLDQAADIWQQTDVADPLGMARTLDSLGFLYHQKRDPRAVETLRKALRLFWQVHGGDHLDVA